MEAIGFICSDDGRSVAYRLTGRRRTQTKARKKVDEQNLGGMINRGGQALSNSRSQFIREAQRDLDNVLKNFLVAAGL